MGRAKGIVVQPISSVDAKRVVQALHYSHKAVNNSKVHLGVFLGAKCGGVLSFGPSLDKRQLMGLVRGTKWNEFIELNRMALADWLPRNGESLALGVALRFLRKQYPWLKWVVSFADGTQCGDGTIYRASGFVLTAIRKNTSIWAASTGERFCRISLTDKRSAEQKRAATNILQRTTMTKGAHIAETGKASMQKYRDAGWRPLPGFQLRYVYFLHPDCRPLLTCPEIPFSKIKEVGAAMYRGQRAESIANDAPCHQHGEGGAIPTSALQSNE